MAHSKLILAAHYLGGLQVHRPLSSRGPQEGAGGVCGAGLGTGPVAHSSNFEVQASLDTPLSLGSSLYPDQLEESSGLHTTWEPSALPVPAAWKTLR